MVILLFLNALALLFGIVLIYVLPKRQRIVFLTVFFSAPLLCAGVALYNDAFELFHPANIGMFMLRGGLLLSVGSGALVCYLEAKHNLAHRLKLIVSNKKTKSDDK